MDAKLIFPYEIRLGRKETKKLAVKVTITMTDSTGKIRLIRFIQNCFRLNRCAWKFFKIIAVIKYPEITKKTSTPRNPPGIHLHPR